MGTTENATWIEPMALRCADSFRETAESFILGKFKSFPKGDLSAWSPILGDIAACATNLAFALEIYLKCLRIQVGLPPRATVGKGHDLWGLYKDFPPQVRKDIEARYERGRTQPYPTHASISFALQRSPVAPNWNDDPQKSMKLEEVLKRSKDTFVSWRYVFEIQKPDQGHGKRQTFEYLLLFLVCVAINAVISRNWFTPRLGKDSTAEQAWLLLNDTDFARVSSDALWNTADVTDHGVGAAGNGAPVGVQGRSALHIDSICRTAVYVTRSYGGVGGGAARLLPIPNGALRMTVATRKLPVLDLDETLVEKRGWRKNSKAGTRRMIDHDPSPAL